MTNMEYHSLSIKSAIKELLSDVGNGDGKAIKTFSSLVSIPQEEVKSVAFMYGLSKLKAIIKARHPYICDTPESFAFYNKVPIYYSYQDTETPCIGYKFKQDYNIRHAIEVAAKHKGECIRNCNENDLYDKDGNILDLSDPSLILWERKAVTKYVFVKKR